jgi:uncharacterized repeat protein (TIGR01451 family)
MERFKGLMSLCFIVTLLLSSLWAAGPPPVVVAEEGHTLPAEPDRPVVARVHFADQADLNELARSLDIWEVDHEAGQLIAYLLPEQYFTLQHAGYQVEVDARRTARLDHVFEPLPGQIAGIPGYPCYRTVEETYTDMQALALNHPNLAQWVDVGDSWEKVMPDGQPGYDLYVLRLTNSAIPGPKPRFFLMAEIHARELTTAELAARYAEYLVENYGTDPDATWLLDYHEIHILVMANPDGRKHAEAGASWRKNTDSDDGCSNPNYWGTDLNRNSTFHWGGAGTDPCGSTYQGPSAGSEPETQSMQTYVSGIFPDRRGPGDDDPAPLDTMGVFITLHSYSRLVIFPWGWSPNPSPNHQGMETLGRKFGYFNGYEVCQSGEPGCIYSTTGTSDDWAYGELGVPAYTFELGTQFFQGCSMFEDTILPNNMPALLYAAKAARLPYVDPSGPEVLNVTATPTTTMRGQPIQLTATADDTRYDSNGWGSEPVQEIAAARYSIDTPLWHSGAVSVTMNAADGAFDETVEGLVATIDTSNLELGRHILFVESQDADGNWGVDSAVFLWVEPAPDSAITGVVRDASTGAPVDQADVSLWGEPSDQFATTGPDGAFHFEVFSGTYDLQAVAYGYYTTTLQDVVAVTGVTTTQDIQLNAIPQGTLSGRVTQSGTGLPLAATLTAVSDYTTLQTTTDPATGIYSLSVFSGTYELTAEASGHVPSSAMVEVHPDLTTTQDFSLENQACLLLVDDDGGQSYESTYQDALDQLGYFYQTWDVAAQGTPSFDTLSSYQVLLWFTADHRNPGQSFYYWDADTLSALTSYVDGGGSLLLTGNNVNAGNYYTTLFEDHFAISYGGDLTAEEHPVHGGGIFADVDGRISSDAYGGAEGYTPDILSPRTGANRVFTYTTHGAGVAHDGGTYRTIDLGFGIEALTETQDQVEILSRGLSWLGCDPSPVELQLAKQAEPDSVPAGGLLTYTLSLTNNGLVTTTGIVISDTLPAGLDVLDASHGGTWNPSGTVSWTLPYLASLETMTVTLLTRVGSLPEGSTIVNKAYSAWADQDVSLWTSGPVTTIVGEGWEWGIYLPLVLRSDAPDR